MATSGHENATVTHKIRFDRQKPWKKCDFELPIATLTHEMRFDRQNLFDNF